MPKLKLEQPLIFNALMTEAECWEGGFNVHTPDSIPPTFIGDLLDLHFPDRDKAERLEPVTDEDIFHDLLVGEYVTPLDTVVVLEHHNVRTQGAPVKAPAESTSFISLKSAFIGLPDDVRDYTILPTPKAEDTSS